MYNASCLATGIHRAACWYVRTVNAYWKKFKETLINSTVRGERSRTMNTEFNKISILNITSFDFASFDKALLSEAEGLRTNGINQSFLKLKINNPAASYGALV